MTHEQRALAKSVQKVRGVLDRYPDGVSLSQITGDTQLSSGAARAALKHMGAECEDGLWFDVAVDEVEQSGNAGELEPEPVTIAESAPVEPVTIEPELATIEPELATIEPVQVDWAAESMAAPVEPEPVTKSDFALALEAERQRVLEAVKIGGTAARLAELTGLPVDDVQQHLDRLIDDGAVVERPIIVAMSYRVAS